MTIGYELNPLDLLLDQCQVLVRNMVATFITHVLFARPATHFQNTDFQTKFSIIIWVRKPMNMETN